MDAVCVDVPERQDELKRSAQQAPANQQTVSDEPNAPGEPTPSRWP